MQTPQQNRRQTLVPDRIVGLALALLAPLVGIFLVLHLVWGIAAALLFPCMPGRVRDALVRLWSRILLVALGLRLEPAPGERLPAGAPGALLLLNHVSWVDVFVLAAVVPARFVAKSEIRDWPLAGWLAMAVGTVFIERGRRHAVSQVNDVVAQRLLSGQSIGIFPEGTTTDGTQLLRFHSNLVQAAMQAQAPVIPVALQYWQDDAPSKAAAFVGEMTLLESIWNILVAPRLSVQLRILEPVAVGEGEPNRQRIAQDAHRAIRAALKLPAADVAAEEQPTQAELDSVESTAAN